MFFVILQRATKAYSFEIEGVPAESEYLEVRYSVSSGVDKNCVLRIFLSLAFGREHLREPVFV